MVHAEKCCYETYQECCRDCSPCPQCIDLSVSKLRDIVYAVNKKIVDYSCGVVNKAHYGYTACDDLSYSNFLILLDYKDSLEKYYRETVNAWPHCLCPEEIQSIYERTLELVDISCCADPYRRDIVMDFSGKDLWNSLHPGCIAFEDWEKSFLRICPKIGIKVKVIDDPDKLTYSARVKSLTGMCHLMNSIQSGNIQNPAAVLASIGATTSSILPKVTKEECSYQYQILVEKTQCDLTYETYVQLLECNMTPSIITRLIECNITLDYNAEKQTCDLIINPETTISLCDLDVNFQVDNVNCELLANITGEPYICEQIAEIIEL